MKFSRWSRAHGPILGMANLCPPEGTLHGKLWGGNKALTDSPGATSQPRHPCWRDPAGETAGKDSLSQQAELRAEVGAQVLRCVPELPAPPRPPGRAWEGAKAERAKGAGAVVAPRAAGGLGDPRWGSPAATALERPLLGLWPSGSVISDLGARDWVLGPARGGSSGVQELFLAGAASARGLFIDQTVRAPCVNGTPRASHAQTFQAPPLAPPPRAPQPAPPPAGTAPPPAPLYGQGLPAVRQRRPRPSPCVTESLRGGSAALGSPSGSGCESQGSVQDSGSALGIKLRLGTLVPAGGAGAGWVGTPMRSVQLS